MRLSDLSRFRQIVIQIHDNPDADAVGSGYALYRYFKRDGRDVRLIYGGRNVISKSNMKLLLQELDIPLEYVTELAPPELLLTVDCQHGQGNVQHFDAENIAMIDHHSTGKLSDDMAEIRSHLVSCASICYSMLKDAGYDANDDTDIATALYYGLYMDSNQLSEISHPIDRDMIDFLQYDKQLISRLKYANFSISELETAGIAITRSNYIEKYRTAIVSSEPCDPNILGVIGDFVIQVDSIDVCMIYNECQGGYKLSVRSCALDVAANELAAFITKGVGNGGGHFNKAGGFISAADLSATGTDIEQHLHERMNEYCNGYDVVRYTDECSDIDSYVRYRKRPCEYGYVKTTDLYEVGTELKIRTLEGDVFVTCEEDVYIMIGMRGEVYPSSEKVFSERYNATAEPFSKEFEYAPTVIRNADGYVCELMPYAKKCISGEGAVVYARPVEKYTKVFTKWQYETYMSGMAGDMLCRSEGDIKDVYIVNRSIFDMTYEKADK